MEFPSEKLQKEFIDAYGELADKLFRHCYFKVSDREKAKDLVQDVFVKSWQHVASGKDILNMKAFLYKIANNLIIDHYRRAKKDVSLDSLKEKGFDHSVSGAEEIFIQAEHSRVVKKLDGIQRKYREIIIWRFIDGLSPREIAEILGVSENIVSVRLNRALKKFKAKINIAN